MLDTPELERSYRSVETSADCAVRCATSAAPALTTFSRTTRSADTRSEARGTGATGAADISQTAAAAAVSDCVPMFVELVYRSVSPRTATMQKGH